MRQEKNTQNPRILYHHSSSKCTSTLEYTSVQFRPLKWLLFVIFIFICSGIIAVAFAIDGKEVSL